MPKIDLSTLDPRLQSAIASVTAKRPRQVIDHILEHGQVTTEDLSNMGYEHPPRAAKDVRDCGIPLNMVRVRGGHGKKIACYTLGDPAGIEHHKMGGRQTLPKELQTRLFALQNGSCGICGLSYEGRYLQVDHRVPYEIAGEAAEPSETSRFMLLCGSCQRKKSWSCEQCVNWTAKDNDTCRTCYWADPIGYQHVATKPVRTLVIMFSENEADAFDAARLVFSPDEVAATAKNAVLSMTPERPR